MVILEVCGYSEVCVCVVILEVCGHSEVCVCGYTGGVWAQ